VWQEQHCQKDEITLLCKLWCLRCMLQQHSQLAITQIGKSNLPGAALECIPGSGRTLNTA